MNLYNLRSIGGVEAFWDEAKRDAYNNNFEKTKILLALFKYSNKIQQNISEPEAFIEWLNIDTINKINYFHELVVEEEEKQEKQEKQEKEYKRQNSIITAKDMLYKPEKNSLWYKARSSIGKLSTFFNY